MSNDVPCRVSADIRRYHSDLNHAEPPLAFDEYDDAMMHDILGNDRLAKPVQDLLLTLRDIKAIRRSFGDESVNNVQTLKHLEERLERLREACKDEWLDIR